MNKKLLFILIIILLTHSGCFLPMLFDTRMTPYSTSSSLNESIERKVYIDRYYAVNHESVSDSILKYNLNFNFDTVVFWMENMHDLIFTFWGSKIVKEKDQYNILYYNPTTWRIFQERLSRPEFHIEIKGDHLLSYQLFQNLCHMELNSIPDTIITEGYLYFNGYEENCRKIGEIMFVRDSVLKIQNVK